MTKITKHVTLAGFRQWAAHQTDVTEVFVRDEHEGVQVTGENGFRVSVFFGFGSYSTRRAKRNEPSRDIDEILAEVTDAEVAVFGPDGEFVHWPEVGDDVVGYVPAEVIYRLTSEIIKLDANARSMEGTFPALT